MDQRVVPEERLGPLLARAAADIVVGPVGAGDRDQLRLQALAEDARFPSPLTPARARPRSAP